MLLCLKNICVSSMNLHQLLLSYFVPRTTCLSAESPKWWPLGDDGDIPVFSKLSPLSGLNVMGQGQSAID